MSSSVAYMRKEWEQSVLGVAVAATLVFIIIVLLSISGWWVKDPAKGNPTRDVPNPFSSIAFEFMNKNYVPAIIARDHAFRIKEDPPKPKPPMVVDVPKPRPVKPRPPKPRPRPPRPKQPPTPPPPPPPPPKIFITYSGSMKLPSGQWQALLHIEDEETGTRTATYVPVDGTIKGIRVSRFDSTSLVIRTARGKRMTIPIRDRTELK